MEKPRPETPLDVEACFSGTLQMPPREIETYFEFQETEDAFEARFKRYLPTEFKELA